MKTYYPQAALEGFGAGLAHKLGVRIDYTTGQPRTDGRTVYLPQITQPLTGGEFEALCGIAIHEAAHVWFDSCPRMARYAGSDRLRAACFNAVLDVADETRIEHFIPSARRLLRTSNLDAAARIRAKGALSAGDPVWAILAVGILENRVRSGLYHNLCPAHLKQDAARAFHILKRCRQRPCKRQHRTRPQWDRLTRAADELVDLLRKHGDGSGAPQPFGTIGADAADAACGKGSPAPGDLPAMAGEAEGEALLDSGSSGRGAGSGAGSGDSGGWSINEGLYAALRPSLAGPVERLARSDEADGFTGGFYSGSRVGRHIERALIDGRCFDRRNGEGEKLHVAILLDDSGSMEDSIANVGAIAQAFADAIGPVADSLSLALFSDTTREVPSFRGASYRLGGTATHLALEWAQKRLASQPGRRVCVLVTDGGPSNPGRTQEFSATLAGCASVIAIAYQFPDDAIRATMPGAHVVAAPTAAGLALQLGMVAQRIAS